MPEPLFADPFLFIGIPDWRSFILAAIFAAIWLWPLGRGWFREPWFWVAIVVSAILFPFSIAWIQVPLQQLIGAALIGALGIATVQQFIVLTALPSLLIASAVQEAVKLLVAVFALHRAGLLERARPEPSEYEGPHPPTRATGRTGLAFGAASGAGYGGFEAFWVFNTVWASGFTTSTVQLAGLTAILPFVERFFTVPFHIGSAALSTYGYVTGRPWRFWLLAVALHTLTNYGALFVQTGLASIVVVEIWVAFWSLVTVGIALYLRFRADFLSQHST